VADAGGLGTIEIKAMRDAGYDTDFSVGITAASSTIGPIIPPSLPLVIYGVMASVSIGELFAAGLIPGLLMAVSLMVMVAWYSRRRNYPRDSSFQLSRLATTFKSAFLPLLTPAIIIGGIITGVFTGNGACHRAFHGNHSRHYYPCACVAAHIRATGYRPCSSGHYRHPEPHAGSIDTTRRYGAVRAIAGIRGTF